MAGNNYQLQSTLIQPPQPLQKKKQEPVAQKKGDIAPVQTSLPPIQSTQQQMAPVSVKGAAAAKQDPRFAQAVQQKFQTELNQRQAEFQKQQAEYEKQVAGAGVTANKDDIDFQLGVINDPNSSAEAVATATARYQQLMSAQVKDVEQSQQYLQAQANLAALAKMSGRDIARSYGVGGAGMGLDASVGLVGAGGAQLGEQSSLAKRYALQAAQQEETLKQQLALEEAEAEELRGLSKSGIQAAQSKYLSELQGKAKVESEAKEAALSDLKNKILFGGELTQDDINKLGLSERDLSELGQIDLSKVSGFSGLKTVEDVEKKLKELEESSTPLTADQEAFKTFYESLKGIQRTADTTDPYAMAEKKELAKINALLKLTGSEEKKEEDIGVKKEQELTDLQSIKSLFGESYTPEQLEELKENMDWLSGETTRTKSTRGGRRETRFDIDKLLQRLTPQESDSGGTGLGAVTGGLIGGVTGAVTGGLFGRKKAKEAKASELPKYKENVVKTISDVGKQYGLSDQELSSVFEGIDPNLDEGKFDSKVAENFKKLIKQKQQEYASKAFFRKGL